MITIKNVKNLSGMVVEQTIESPITRVIDGEGCLVMIPAIIDIHAKFRDHESWQQTAREYLEAGITTVFDANACSAKNITSRRQQVDQLSEKYSLPLHVNFLFDANAPEEFDSIGKNKSSVVAISVSLDLAKKPIAAPHISALDRLFQIAAQENMIVSVTLLQGEGGIAEQRKTAYESVATTIQLAEKYSTELCLQHVRTKEELTLIKDAKDRGLLIHVEVAYPHLFLTDKDFPKGFELGGATLFLPDEQDHHALWEGVHNGSVDMIGSAGGFAPPGLLLPLLMESCAEKRITLDTIVQLTRVNPEVIFRLPSTHDVILLDPKAYKTIPQEIINGNTILSRWHELSLSGWPVHVVTGAGIITCP